MYHVSAATEAGVQLLKRSVVPPLTLVVKRGTLAAQNAGRTWTLNAFLHAWLEWRQFGVPFAELPTGTSPYGPS